MLAGQPAMRRALALALAAAAFVAARATTFTTPTDGFTARTTRSSVALVWPSVPMVQVTICPATTGAPVADT